MRRALPLLLACACASGADDPGRAYIAPLDGQTGVPPSLDLLVSTRGLDLPADYPVDPELIRVVDLDAGKLVAGETWRDGPDIRFTPARKWTEGHVYAWSVADAPPDGRQPQLTLPALITGEATFQVSDGAAVLDAGIDVNGTLCLLLSVAVQTPPEVELTLNGEPQSGSGWVLREEGGSQGPLKLLDEDPGVSISCWVGGPELAGGESLHVWWADAGPWHFTLDRVKAYQLSAEERRRAAR